MPARRTAEVVFVGDAASIVRAAKQAEAASAQAAAAAKKGAEETAAANKAAGDSAVTGGAKQVAAHKRTASSIAGVGAAMSKMTAPILVGAAASVKFAIDFQKNMELVHTQAGATTSEVTKMSAAVLKLGLTTEQGPNALAKALYPLESVGLRGKTAMLALGAASKGAAIGQSDLTETTHALAGVMVALHQNGSQAAKTMGAIDAVVGVGKMTMQDFVQALSSGIIPTAKAVGLSFNSIGAGLATLTDAGIPAEMAATKMRTILLMLAHEHTSAAVDGLKSVGLTADQLATTMRKPGNGLLDVLQLLHSHMDGLSKVKQVDLMSSLAGGSRSAGTLITLEQQLGRVSNKYGQISTLSGQFNSRVAAESETASHKIKVAWSAVQSTMIQVGGSLAPVVTSLAGDVSKVAQAFTALPPGLQHTIVTGGLVLAGVGPALKLLGIFTSGLGKLREVAMMVTGARMLGGGGAVGGASSVAAGAGATESAAAGLGAGIRGIASRAVGGVAIGGLGVLISQTVGAAVHGGVGSAIKTIGTDASIGAGIGAIFGPAGMAGGAIIGGLVGTFTHFDKSYGATIGGKLFSGGFGGAAADSLAKQTAAALDQLHKLTTKAGQTITGPHGVTVHMPLHVAMDQLTGAALTAATAAANKAGTLVAKSLEAGWSQYKFQSEPIMFGQLRAKMAELAHDPAAQAAGVSSAVKFAQGLESQGRLVKGSAAKMLSDIEAQFPGFEKYLGLAAGAGIQQFNKAFDFSKTEQHLKGQLTRISSDFSPVQKAVSNTAGTVQEKAAAAIAALKQIVDTGTGPMRKKATADLAALRASTSDDMTAMSSLVVSKTKQMAGAIEQGSSQASSIAATNMGSFSQHVTDAMNNGLVSTGKGMQLIIQTLNQALKAMGQKQLSPIQVGAMTLNVGKTAQLTHHAAGGALVQYGRAGDSGGDTIPASLMVGSGEVGAVFNRHQLPIVNGALAHIGGLSGLFSKVRTPHNMATGGYVFPYGKGLSQGRTDMGTDWTGAGPIAAIGSGIVKIAQGQGSNTGWPGASGGGSGGYINYVLTSGPDAGRYIYLAENIDPTVHAGQQIRAGQIIANARGAYPFTESGWASGPINQTLAQAHGGTGAGSTPQGAAFTNFIMGLAHGKLTGGGGSVPNINVPKVSGIGAIADLVRGGLGKVAAAANKKLQALAAAGSGGGSFTGTLNGPVAHQVAQFMGAAGFNKTAIAGILGNAAQESNQNPNTPGGGMWQQISNFGSGTGGSLLHQMQTMLPQIQSLKGALNAAGSAGAAATIFMQGFERPLASAANLPHRIAAANAAMAAGYAKGGMLPFAGSFKHGGVVPHDGLALVHRNETVIPASTGHLTHHPSGISKNPATGILANIGLISAQALYPLDAALTALTAKIADLQASGVPLHTKEIAALTDELAKIRKERINLPPAANTGKISSLEAQLVGLHRQKINLPGTSGHLAGLTDHLDALRMDRLNMPTAAAGKAGRSQRLANDQQRKQIAAEILSTEQKIRSVKGTETAANAAKRKALENETLTIETKIKGLKASDTSAGARERKRLALETLNVEERIKELKEKDKSAKTSLADTIRGLNLQTKSLTQLKTYTDAITGLKTQMKDLAGQAAQAWSQLRTTNINNVHDAAITAANTAHGNAIAAITNGPQSQQLAGMQSQDKIDAAERQMDSLNKGLASAQKGVTSAQFLVGHSAGQTHVDALAALETAKQGVQDAQQQITDFMRQQDEQRLQDQIASATSAADATQTVAVAAADGAQQTALAALTQQTADYQASLDNQLGALTGSLNARKITYAAWAKDVNAILSQYGLAVPTDATTEQTVITGPGVGGAASHGPRPIKVRAQHPSHHFGGHRAGGGPVEPGYVYRVGEHGPEDVAFGRRGTVMTAAQTRADSRNGPALVINGGLHVNGYAAARSMADRLAFRAAFGTA